MFRSLSVLITTLVVATALTGCGLAETGIAGATQGAAQVEQARQAKQTEAQVQQQLDSAMQQAASQRKAGEAESQ
jgi:hypothetical protein